MNRKKLKTHCWFPNPLDEIHFDKALNQFINSVKEDCVKKVKKCKVRNYSKKNQPTRTMFDNVNHVLDSAISAIRDSKE